MRFPDWRAPRQPELGDVTYEIDGPDGDDLDRWYEVVGVIDTRTGYRLVCERIATGELPANADAVWPHHRV